MTHTTQNATTELAAQFAQPMTVPDQFIAAITQCQETSAVSTAISEAMEGHAVAGLRNEFAVHDLERYRQTRRRARGTMTTRSMDAFAQYTAAHATGGATVFVNSDAMTATAVLDLGTPEAPGHADHLAKFEPKATAAYAALTAIACGSHTQQEVAEFLEDWAPHLLCSNADGNIKTHAAIAAVRKITIESLHKLESEEQALGATRSAFESVQASSKDPLPTSITFTCHPYADLDERTFVLRLSVLTGEGKPKLRLRITKIEEHVEAMAQELVERIALAMNDASAPLIPVLSGQYRKAD